MADNLYGGVSVQIYPGGEATLTTPHGDVKAFLDYVGRFNDINFHAMDEDVRKKWRYNQEYDNWQDRLGIDSVRVVYHYGHMGMAADGRFVAGMGRTWDNTFQADSSRMSFGDQRLRYLFLHGCDSLQMHFGQNPFRTWAKANKGARMIFGFDSLTYDVDGLGAGFFREWNTGKSFSQAWQDAALATRTDHRPATTACGATAEEAQDRLWNERLFDGGAVSDAWYWWRWAGPAPIEVQLGIGVPRTPPLDLELSSRGRNLETAARLANRFGVRPSLAGIDDPEVREGQGRSALEGPRLVLLADGSYQVFLGPPDRAAPCAEIAAIKESADRTVRAMGLDVELVFAGLTATHHAGASRRGEQRKEAIADFTAHYRQVYNGIPAAVGGDGHLVVTLDPAGKVCAIADRTVRIVGAVEARPTTGRDLDDPEAALDDAEKALRRTLRDGPCKSELKVVPGSFEVGYRYERGLANAVARRVVEIRTGDYAIRKILEVSL